MSRRHSFDYRKCVSLFFFNVKSFVCKMESNYKYNISPIPNFITDSLLEKKMVPATAKMDPMA